MPRICSLLPLVGLRLLRARFLNSEAAFLVPFLFCALLFKARQRVALNHRPIRGCVLGYVHLCLIFAFRLRSIRFDHGICLVLRLAALKVVWS